MTDNDERVRNIALDGELLPPAPGLCQKCACDHPDDVPHNQQSLFWQYWFYKQSGGTWPTWADAMAHCAPEIQQRWREILLDDYGIEVP